MKTVKVSGSCLKHEGSFLKSVACFCSEKPALGCFTFSQYLGEAKASLHIVAIFSSENFYLRELPLINLSSCSKYNSGSSSLHQTTEMLSFPICFSSGGACIRKLVGKNPLSVPVRCQRPSTNLHTNIRNNKINTVLHGFFSSLTDEQQWLVTWVCHQLKCTLDQLWPVTYHYWEKLAVGHVLDERDFFSWP